MEQESLGVGGRGRGLPPIGRGWEGRIGRARTQPPGLTGGVGGVGDERGAGIGAGQALPDLSVQGLRTQRGPKGADGAIGRGGGRGRWGGQRPVVVRAVFTISWARPMPLL